MALSIGPPSTCTAPHHMAPNSETMLEVDIWGWERRLETVRLPETTPRVRRSFFAVFWTPKCPQVYPGSFYFSHAPFAFIMLMHANIVFGRKEEKKKGRKKPEKPIKNGKKWKTCRLEFTSMRCENPRISLVVNREHFRWVVKT